MVINVCIRERVGSLQLHSPWDWKWQDVLMAIYEISILRQVCCFMLTRPTLICSGFCSSERRCLCAWLHICCPGAHAHMWKLKGEALNKRSGLNTSSSFSSQSFAWLWEGLGMEQYILAAVATVYGEFICYIRTGSSAGKPVWTFLSNQLPSSEYKYVRSFGFQRSSLSVWLAGCHRTYSRSSFFWILLFPTPSLRIYILSSRWALE